MKKDKIEKGIKKIKEKIKEINEKPDEVKYPKLPKELDMRVKLTVPGIIRVLYYDVGISQRGMGRLFNVDKTTIGAYLKTSLENRKKRYNSFSYGLVRENPTRRKERRNILLDKYLVWEREKGFYKREKERKRNNKNRKRPYHPILLLRKLFRNQKNK